MALPVIAALACAALAGCGNTLHVKEASAAVHPVAPGPPGAIVCPHAGQVDRLTMRRINAIPQNLMRFTFPGQITITSARRAQAVARALCALPPMPHDRFPMHCPIDLGITYQLSFAAGASRFQAVDADPGGCMEVYGLGRPRWAISAAFWKILGTAAGIPHPGYPAFRGVQVGEDPSRT